MALFGKDRDISLFRNLNRELLNRIIEQKIGYYKLDLSKTKSNLYGESLDKFYLHPVLLNCLIERGDKTESNNEQTFDLNRDINVRFLRDDLLVYNVYPEVGDIILWNNDYYEVFNVNENQLIVGKDPSYSYDETINSFGSSWSIIVSCTYVRPEKLGISQTRL